MSARARARGAIPMIAAVAMLTAFGVLAGPVSAQDENEGPGLGDAAMGVARAWQAADVDALAVRFEAGGIRLQLPNTDHPALSVRLARAALEDLHGALGTGPVTVRQVRLLGGEPPRGFTELSWTPLPEGTTEAVAHTVFVGLVRQEGGAWRILEIRVLPTPDAGGGEAGDIDDINDSDDQTDERWR